MPFVNKAHRLNPDPAIPGDRCFVYYRTLMRHWKTSPCWTTANDLFCLLLQQDFDSVDDEAAAWLAWQVFFQLHVMPYEIKKREENGDIE